MDDLTFYKKIDLDIQHRNFADHTAVEADALRGFVITPYNDREPLDLADVESAYMLNTAGVNEAAVYRSEGRVSADKKRLEMPITPGTLGLGRNAFVVFIVKAGKQIAFPGFFIYCCSSLKNVIMPPTEYDKMLEHIDEALAENKIILTEATAAKNAAEAAVTEAQTAVTQAQQHEEQARACQEKSCACATESQKSATAAGKSAVGAKGDKDAAAKSATDAAASAAKAKTSETNAKTAETGAANSAAEANQSKVAAKASADNAKTNADNAANSATKAGTQATTATNKAAEAAASATAAKGSQDAAALSAQAADAKATAAAGSANTAERASNSAGVAATAAFDNANDAKASADKAKASETGAETAKAQAQTIADNLQGTVDAANQATTRANTAAERAEQAAQTVQPDATKTSKGIVQIGDGINIDGGVISVPAPDLSSKADKVHKHSTADINGLDAALNEAGKVKSVNGQTGDVTILAVPTGGTVGQVLKKTPTGFDWDDDDDTQPDLMPYAKTADLDKKVDKVSGKGLSTEDYTTDEKTKLAGVEKNANKYTLPTASAQKLGGVKVGDGISVSADGEISVQEADGTNPGLSVNNYTAEDKGKLTGIEEGANKFELKPASTQTLGGIKVGANLSVGADGTLSATDTTYNTATTTSSGLMSAADKNKVDAIGSASEAPDITDKSSVWAAINEAASKGGGGLKITVSTENAPATGEANSVWFKVV